MFASSLLTLITASNTGHLHKQAYQRCFEEEVEDSGEIMKQLEGREIESAELQPMNLWIPKLGAKWMVKIAA